MSMTLVRRSLLLLTAAGLAGAALAAPAPHIGIATLDELARPLPLPYDEHADAMAEVAAGRARAKASHKTLLIDLGGNWCPDCRLLAGVMARPEMQAFVRRHFEVVTVDIGRMDKNQAIPAHYGIPRLQGVPALLIVEPRHDRLINAGHVSALSDARSMTPQALADWLAQWV